jgi:hypothetical protein
LLGADAKVQDSTFVRAGFGTLDEGASSFAIDNSGRHVIRLIVEGEENGSFCVLMGGTALPSAKDANCPGRPRRYLRRPRQKSPLRRRRHSSQNSRPLR